MSAIVKNVIVQGVLDHNGTNVIQITWNVIVPTITDITKFSVWRSIEGYDDYVKIGDSCIGSYEDSSIEQIPGLEYIYKVLYTNPDGESSLDEATATGIYDYESLGYDGRLYYVFLESIRRLNLVLLNIGESCNIYLRRKVGERCPECWNFTTSKAENPQCSTCFGVGFRNGYYKVANSRVVIEQAEEKIKETQFGLDVSQPLKAWIGNLPIVAEGDVLVRNDNTRYYITSADRKMLQNYMIQQYINLEKIDPSNPVYNIN
jgi:hypothetical protein